MNGVVNVFKPPGPTSNDIVVELRRLLGVKRVGHLGTLDPGAAGVLPVCLGSATRLFDLLVEKRKTYLAEVVFGVSTTTQDAFGTALEYAEADVSAARLEAALRGFTGEIEQTPSAYSAIKVGGRRQYELARQGQTEGAKARRVHIYDLRLVDQLANGRFLIRVECSRGTYVRTLAHDLGRALGTCAHMGFLLRVQNGAFSIETALTAQEIAQLHAAGRLDAHIVRPETLLMELPAIHAPRERLVPFMNGLPTSANCVKHDGSLVEGRPCRLYCGADFLGVCILRDGEIRLDVRLVE